MTGAGAVGSPHTSNENSIHNSRQVQILHMLQDWASSPVELPDAIHSQQRQEAEACATAGAVCDMQLTLFL
jgi:hypothetical protein